MGTKIIAAVDSLFGKTRQLILNLLYGNTDTSFYTRQVLDFVNAGHGAVQRELQNLTDSGVIVRKVRGNQVHYQANKNCPVFEELRNLVLRMHQPSAGETAEVSFPGSRIGAAPEKLAEFCSKHHISKLSLFGSVLRDDFRPDSDIDVLAEFEPDFVPGFAIIDIENELSLLLKRKTDLRTPGDLSRYIRDQVVKEAKTVYEA